MKRNMKMLWKKTANSRVEMSDFCERSVFESLVNGLIHRDYLVNGSEVHIYSDRVLFMVTLKNLNYKMSLNEAKSEAKNEAKNEAENIALTELEKRLCGLLKENSKITQAEIQKEIGLSRSKVQRTMKKLVNEGVIENIGSHRSGQWKVKRF